MYLHLWSVHKYKKRRRRDYFAVWRALLFRNGRSVLKSSNIFPRFWRIITSFWFSLACFHWEKLHALIAWHRQHAIETFFAHNFDFPVPGGRCRTERKKESRVERGGMGWEGKGLGEGGKGWERERMEDVTLLYLFWAIVIWSEQMSWNLTGQMELDSNYSGLSWKTLSHVQWKLVPMGISDVSHHIWIVLNNSIIKLG